MLRDCKRETDDRVAWIKAVLVEAGANAIVFGSSGGKDAVLTGALCKMACDNTFGIILPCESRRNFEEDAKDALLFAEHFGIEHISVDLTPPNRLWRRLCPWSLMRRPARI